MTTEQEINKLEDAQSAVEDALHGLRDVDGAIVIKEKLRHVVELLEERTKELNESKKDNSSDDDND